MEYFTNLLTYCLILFITIDVNVLSSQASSIQTTHYKSQHFDWNNRQQWSPMDSNANIYTPTQEIISCTLNIPSLCIYAVPSMPGFHVFYGDQMFDFLNDANWSTIIVTNNLDNEEYNDIVTHLFPFKENIENTENKAAINSQRRRLRRGRRSRRRRRRAARKRRAALKMRARNRRGRSRQRSSRHRGRNSRYKARGRSYGNGYRGKYNPRTRRRSYGTAISRFNQLQRAMHRMRSRKRHSSRDSRMRRRVYSRLYRFGKLLGKSMKTGNFGGICGLTGECYQKKQRKPVLYVAQRRSRRKKCSGGCGSRCGMRRKVCPTRFATYLGPPHIIGRPSYILGSPPTGHAPMGYGQSRGFGQGLGVSPMYYGMMGGMHGMQAPGQWPGYFGGMSGNPQAMMGDMGYGRKSVQEKPEKKVVTKVIKKEATKAAKKEAKKAVKKVAKKKRRLIDDSARISDMDIYNDIRLKKCVFVGGDNEEICASYYYKDGSVGLEYNYNVDGMPNDTDMQYIKANVWIWNENKEENVECNGDLLEYIGYIVCIQYHMDNDRDNIYGLIVDDDVNDSVVKRLDLMNGKEVEWDKIYEINGRGNNRKICEYIEMIELCFEMTSDYKTIEITTQRVLLHNANSLQTRTK